MVAFLRRRPVDSGRRGRGIAAAPARTTQRAEALLKPLRVELPTPTPRLGPFDLAILGPVTVGWPDWRIAAWRQPAEGTVTGPIPHTTAMPGATDRALAIGQAMRLGPYREYRSSAAGNHLETPAQRRPAPAISGRTGGTGGTDSTPVTPRPPNRPGTTTVSPG